MKAKFLGKLKRNIRPILIAASLPFFLWAWVSSHIRLQDVGHARENQATVISICLAMGTLFFISGAIIIACRKTYSLRNLR
jgi:hypothetical protein